MLGIFARYHLAIFCVIFPWNDSYCLNILQHKEICKQWCCNILGGNKSLAIVHSISASLSIGKHQCSITSSQVVNTLMLHESIKYGEAIGFEFIQGSHYKFLTLIIAISPKVIRLTFHIISISCYKFTMVIIIGNKGEVYVMNQFYSSFLVFYAFTDDSILFTYWSIIILWHETAVLRHYRCEESIKQGQWI